MLLDNNPHIRVNREGDYWRASWRENGKLIRRGVGKHADHASALAAAHNIAWHKADTKQPKKQMALGPWMTRYLALRCDYSLDTISQVAHVAKMAEEFWGQIPINRITRSSVQEWAVWLEQGGRSRSTVLCYLKHMAAAFARAVDERRIVENPFARPRYKVPRVHKDWAQITDDDMQRILAACPNRDWQALFALARWAGLRRGEILRLTWDCIDWQKKIIHIKPDLFITTKQKPRIVPIEKRLFDLLYLQWSLDTTQPGPCRSIPVTTAETRCFQIIEQAGLKRYEKPFHTLRKNRESEWMAKFPVLSVAAWMGHSPEIAAKYYVRDTPEILAAVTG